MVVLATDVGRAQGVVRTLPHAGEIRVQTARYSGRELDRIRADVQSVVGAAGFAQVNQQANRVDVWTDRPALGGALAARGLDPGAYSVRAQPVGTPTDCETVFDCDPPFRGGLSVAMKHDPADMGTFCTSGFNLVDDQGHFYATTAGHCITLAPDNPQGMYHNEALIANVAGAAFQNLTAPLRDFAVMPIDDPAVWMPHPPRNILRFHCVQPSPSPCDATLNLHRYQILQVRNYANMAIGNLVCQSGASIRLSLVAAGTRCGEITALPAGAIQTNICSRRGDSGSPLFDQATRTAFGIESQVVAPNNPEAKCADEAVHMTLYTAVSRVLNIASNLLAPRTITVVTAP
jgi:streptogrisin C